MASVPFGDLESELCFFAEFSLECCPYYYGRDVEKTCKLGYIPQKYLQYYLYESFCKTNMILYVYTGRQSYQRFSDVWSDLFGNMQCMADANPQQRIRLTSPAEMSRERRLTSNRKSTKRIDRVARDETYLSWCIHARVGRITTAVYRTRTQRRPMGTGYNARGVVAAQSIRICAAAVEPCRDSVSLARCHQESMRCEQEVWKWASLMAKWPDDARLRSFGPLPLGLGLYLVSNP